MRRVTWLYVGDERQLALLLPIKKIDRERARRGCLKRNTHIGQRRGAASESGAFECALWLAQRSNIYNRYMNNARPPAKAVAFWEALFGGCLPISPSTGELDSKRKMELGSSLSSEQRPTPPAHSVLFTYIYIYKPRRSFGSERTSANDGKSPPKRHKTEISACGAGGLIHGKFCFL